MRAVSFFLLFLSITAFNKSNSSNTYESDLAKVYSTYNLAYNYSCNIEIDVISGVKNPKVIESIKAIQKKRGSDFYYELGNVVYLMNKLYAVVVNKREQTIFIDKRTEQKIKSGLVDEQIDSLLRIKNNSVVLLSESDSIVKYRITNSKAYISSIEVWIDKTTWSFDRFIYRYNNEIYNEQKVVVRYMNFNTKPAFKNSDFSEMQIVEKRGNEYTGAGVFKNYIIYKNFK